MPLSERQLSDNLDGAEKKGRCHHGHYSSTMNLTPLNTFVNYPVNALCGRAPSRGHLFSFDRFVAHRSLIRHNGVLGNKLDSEERKTRRKNACKILIGARIILHDDKTWHMIKFNS